MRLPFWFKISREFIWRFRRVILLGTLLGLSFFYFLPRIPAVWQRIVPTETVGLVGRYTVDTLPLSIQQEISLGLTTFDDNFNTRPGIATSWQAQEAGQVWIFKLGRHLWQDGRPVRASEINYNFADVQLEVQDEATLKFTLADPFAPFPAAVSRPVFRRGLLGAGEWRVTRLSLVSKQYVQSVSLANIRDGRLKTYRFYPTEEAARTAFKLGEVTKLAEIVEPGDLTHWRGAQIEKDGRLDRYVGLFINTNDPLLSEKNLRQGLAYALKKDFAAPRALGPISPLSWAANPQVKPYAQNSARARELLDTSGNKTLEVSLVTSPTLLSVADQIRADWEAVGVKTNLGVVAGPPPDFQILLAIQTIPPDPDQYNLWHSTQTTTNITNYGEQAEDKKPRESQRIDLLLEEGRKTLDQEERKKIYLDFQRFLVEDSPVIFLFHPSTYTISRK